METVREDDSKPLRAHDEFPAGAMHWPSELSRREFLQRLAASLAFAGLAGCARRLPDKIVPSVTPDRLTNDGADVRSFATAIASEGYARGILVTARGGRPTKIEGNPDHPESFGATDVFTQAAILSLYDPDRSRAPLRAGQPATWTAFENEWLTLHRELVALRGEGLVLLTEPTTSPTQQREIHRVLETFRSARWFQHTPLARYDHRGAQSDFDFTKAEVILSIASDGFYRHPAAIRYARALASGRRVENGEVHPPRFYALEPTPSVTVTLADFRLPVAPQRLGALLDFVADALVERGVNGQNSLTGEEQRFVHALVDDIRSHGDHVACIAASECGSEILDWAATLNARFGARVISQRAALRSDTDARNGGDLAELSEALGRKDVRALFILGSNPVYTAPAEFKFGQRLRDVPFTVHLGEYRDETAACMRWHLPESHFLETWSDLRAYSGAATIQQPVVEPFAETRSIAEILRMISSPPGVSAFDLVRETWRAALDSGDNFETRWHAWLSRGVVDLDFPRGLSKAQPAVEFPRLFKEAKRDSLTIVFQPDPNILDGRFANNGWLQELPKPLTKLVWENAVLVSSQLAHDRKLSNGDLVSCEIDGASIEAPIWVMPGQAASVITLPLGYGRTHAGNIGNELGFDAYRLRDAASPWYRESATLRKLDRRHSLVSTQEHFAMEARDLVRVVTPLEAARRSHAQSSDRAREAAASSQPSLYASWPRDRYAWAMSIDLGTCLGCNACVIACQAENNIPVVGREQVARGREMHWLRVDRYFVGDPANPRFVHQPVPCMHCENAPCEIVCPVGATVHSSEGLNDMVYNRCVGTRYCSNNCPYKVRRFNFLDYRAPRGSPLHLQSNPDVTVRERGVMEKCTYCVQRINAARIAANRENRSIRDGEIRTACEQACPAEAIVFGDLNDPTSRVSRRKSEPTDYALLAELNTRPRTTYLAAVRHDIADESGSEIRATSNLPANA